MTRGAWASSGKRPESGPRARDPRPAGSWSAAVDRARRSWDELTGGPGLACSGCGGRHGCARAGCMGDLVPGPYSDAAAAAILAAAVALWGDTAAAMGGGFGPE